jgi:hypothetical protein
MDMRVRRLLRAFLLEPRLVCVLLAGDLLATYSLAGDVGCGIFRLSGWQDVRVLDRSNCLECGECCDMYKIGGVKRNNSRDGGIGIASYELFYSCCIS